MFAVILLILQAKLNKLAMFIDAFYDLKMLKK
jgi:hypothetical protein